MKKNIIILLISFVTYIANAQEKTTMFLNFSPSVSLGEAADFANNISPRGFDFESNYFFREDMSVGVVVGWNLFREKVVGETLSYGELAITGTQFRYLNTTPINLNIKKYFIANDFSPYIGVGLGTAYAKKSTDIGVLSLSDDKWLFNIAPEIGFLYELTSRNVYSVKIKYNYSPKAGDFSSVSYLSLGLGVGLN